MAVLEVEYLEVEDKKREEVYQEVISQQGPPDGTVVVSLPNQEDMEDELVEAVVEKLGTIGDIILVRLAQLFIFQYKYFSESERGKTYSGRELSLINERKEIYF